MLLIATSLHGANYYCATNGLDTNPGSEAEPFLTLAKPLTLVNPGDSIYLGSGQFDGTNYVSTTRSGSSGNYISIDGQNQAQISSIYIQNPYYYIRNLTFKGGSGNFLIYMERTADFCVITNNVLDCESWPARSMIRWNGPASYPFSDAGNNNLVISNRMFNGANEGAGITMYGSFNVFEGNFLYDSDTVDWLRIFGLTNRITGNIFSNMITSGIAGHADWLQISTANAGSQYHVFEKNVVNKMSTVGGDAQLLFLTTGGVAELGDFVFRNNIFIDVALRGTIGFRNVQWYNNTFIRCASDNVLLFIVNTNETYPDFDINSGHGGRVLNNIFLDCATTVPTNMNYGYYSFDPDLTNVTADYNFVAKNNYQAFIEDPGMYPVGDPSKFNYLQWFELHGINGGNPMLVNETDNSRPLAGSPLINAGTNLSAYFTDDFDGNTRSGWTIGAFEFVNTATGTPKHSFHLNRGKGPRKLFR